MTKKAWRVTVDDLGPAIVFAATRQKAKWVAVSSYWEAYPPWWRGEWPSISIGRAGEYDHLADEKRFGVWHRAWGEDYLRDFRRTER